MKIIVNDLADLEGFAYNIYGYPFIVSMGIHSDEYALTIEIDFYKLMRDEPYAIIDGIFNCLMEGSLLTQTAVNWWAKERDYYEIPMCGVDRIIPDSDYEERLLIRYLGQFPETKSLLNLIDKIQ